MTRFTPRTALLGTSLLLTGAAAHAHTPKSPKASKDTTKPAPTTGSNPNDPRSSLKPGLYDAGETAMSMQHIAFLKKPAAFQINPTGPDDPIIQKTLDQIGAGQAKLTPAMRPVIAQLAFANSDFAFAGHTLFQGNFYGVNFYDITDPSQTRLLTSLVCPGGQGDVSVYGHLLFMSVEMPNGRLDCGTGGFAPPPTPTPDPAANSAPSPEPGSAKKADDKEKAEEKEPAHHNPPADPARFRGVRIFDISDLHNPKQVAAVQTCRGSHTHTLVTDPSDPANIYVYVSGTSFVRQSEELAGCSDTKADDPNTSLFRIDVIKVPLSAPQDAKIVASPRVFIDPRSGALNGLNNGGAHGKAPGDAPEKVADTNQCHDITAYSAMGLAAGACSGNGLLLDIHDPVHPKRIDAVNDPNYSYWHSATFSNDGKKVVFTDEWGGGIQPRCRPTDPLNWGADAIFNITDDKLKFDGYYKMPAAQGPTENCVAHNGSLVPVPGRDIEVQAWYQGGISVVDFTDPAHPQEIGYFDRGPIDAKNAVLGGDWSAYWYNGYIYGSEIARGLDVFKLTPGKLLTANEIAAANQVTYAEFNVQNQQPVTWPNTLLTARAYLDQLARTEALPSDQISKLNKAVEDAQKHNLDDKRRTKLTDLAPTLDTAATSAKTPADTTRLKNLATILRNPAA